MKGEENVFVTAHDKWWRVEKQEEGTKMSKKEFQTLLLHITQFPFTLLALFFFAHLFAHEVLTFNFYFCLLFRSFKLIPHIQTHVFLFFQEMKNCTWLSRFSFLFQLFFFAGAAAVYVYIYLNLIVLYRKFIANAMGVRM